MDQMYSVEFFSSFLENLQNLCQMYLSFDQFVEISGYISLEIDSCRKERYAVSEIIQSTGNVLSESHLLKAFSTSDIADYHVDGNTSQSNVCRRKLDLNPKDTEYNTGDYQEDIQLPVILEGSAVSLKGFDFPEKGELPDNVICVGQHKRKHQEEESNQRWNRRSVHHKLKKLWKKNSHSHSSFSSGDRDNESSSEYCHPTSDLVEFKKDNSQKSGEVCFIDSEESHSEHTDVLNSRGSAAGYSSSSSSSDQYHLATPPSQRTDALSSESKRGRMKVDKTHQKITGGKSFSHQKHHENLQCHTFVNVKKEVMKDVVYSYHTDDDVAFPGTGEQEQTEMSFETECDTTSALGKKWNGKEEHYSVAGSPEGKEEIVMDDEEDSMLGLETGSLDMSLLDTAAQYKLATFKKSLQSGLNTFIRFLQLKQIKEPVLSMSPDMLDEILAEFYVCARTKSGQEFTSGSLRTIKNYLEYFLQHNGYPVSIVKGKEFEESSNVLKQRLSYLRSHEKSSVAVQREDVDMMFNSGILGTGTPEALIRTLWMMITVHFQIKGAKKHLMMNWGDFELEVSNEGEEYLCYKPLGIIARGNNMNPSRCFVSYYKTYKALRPERSMTFDHPFYLESANNVFQTNRISENAMKCMWKRILIDANLPKEKKILDMNIL